MRRGSTISDTTRAIAVAALMAMASTLAPGTARAQEAPAADFAPIPDFRRGGEWRIVHHMIMDARR